MISNISKTFEIKETAWLGKWSETKPIEQHSCKTRGAVCSWLEVHITTEWWWMHWETVVSIWYRFGKKRFGACICRYPITWQWITSHTPPNSCNRLWLFPWFKYIINAWGYGCIYLIPVGEWTFCCLYTLVSGYLATYYKPRPTKPM